MRITAAVLFLLIPSLAASAGEFQQGMDALTRNDFDGAIRCFTVWLQANPQDARAYTHRGNAYSGKQAFDQAVADFSQAIRLDPTNVALYVMRGNAHFSQAVQTDPAFVLPASAGAQHFDEAIGDFSRAIRLDPKCAVAYNNRGDAYLLKKEYGNAIADYTRAVRDSPKYLEAYLSLAWLLATCPVDGVRNGKEAVQYATIACELSQWRNADALDTLAAANAEAGNFPDAVKWERQALELWHDNKEEFEKAGQRVRLYEAGKPYRCEGN
jgi:tetratricopeptide (TPR) repeat protein